MNIFIVRRQGCSATNPVTDIFPALTKAIMLHDYTTPTLLVRSDD